MYAGLSAEPSKWLSEAHEISSLFTSSWAVWDSFLMRLWITVMAVTPMATIRVKRVVDCNVEAQALIDPNWQFGCSDDPNSALKWSLPAGTQFFNIPGTPFINKVKNYTKNVQGDGAIYSFDAQFMFWLP